MDSVYEQGKMERGGGGYYSAPGRVSETKK